MEPIIRGGLVEALDNGYMGMLIENGNLNLAELAAAVLISIRENKIKGPRIQKLRGVCQDLIKNTVWFDVVYPPGLTEEDKSHREFVRKSKPKEYEVVYGK